MNATPDGLLRLTCRGTAKDLRDQGLELHEGMEILAYDEEFEVGGTVVFVATERAFAARVDWDQLRPTDPEYSKKN